MKKTYIRPTIYTYHIAPHPLLTISDGGLNVSSYEEGNAAEAASRGYDDDDW